MTKKNLAIIIITICAIILFVFIKGKYRNYIIQDIIVSIEEAYSEKNYPLAKGKINLLNTRYPESSKNKEYLEMVVRIDSAIAESSKKLKTVENERIRLENLNKTGIWDLLYYVDEFGEPTSVPYLTNKENIIGSFSNSVTDNSRLSVHFLISSSSDIKIKLYKYFSKIPVKQIGSMEHFMMKIQDNAGERSSVQINLMQDRLWLFEKGSNIVHDALLRGGEVKFLIKNSNTTYRFNIVDASHYSNAYRKLQNSK
ncbi:MAG: hypothetical protein K9M19_04855 [Candidatus Marinimicrobia bacterium]|nr:hypothetical protein [Candidatus Neomarinimicrobiota bacterium]